MSPEERALIQNALNLISNIEHWHQYSDAADNTGRDVGARDGNAYCWCAEGALVRAAPPGRDQLRINCGVLLCEQAVLMFGGSIVAVNDGEVGIPDDCTDDDRAYTLAHANVCRVFEAVLS